jgi:hypothetical protein
MAKAPKATASQFTVKGDTAIIARDFATFGHVTVNNDARTAMLRRVTDKDAFKAIRIAALAAWLVASGRGYDDAGALRNVDGTLANPKAFGNGAKRDEAQQKDYKDAGAAWSYYLAVNGIETLTRAKAKRAPRAPGALVDNSTKAPPAALSAVVPVRGDLAIVSEQFKNCTALMGRIIAENNKAVTGDKGAALRALHIHCQNEMKRIASLKD